MTEKLSVPPRSVAPPINHESFPEDPQTPEALGNSRFKKRELHLWGSDVLAWDGRFHEAPRLRELRIQSSSTSHIPEDIKTLRHLRTLIILNVFLHEFPLWICEMTQLEKLMVRGTNITRIPEEISTLTKLRELDVANNLLTQFNADLRQCRNLNFLAISDNDLCDLPPKIPPSTVLGLAGTPFRLYTGLPFKKLPSSE